MALTKKGYAFMSGFALIILVVIGFFLDKAGGTKILSGLGSGRSNKTINVCVVTWGGYAGGQYFNAGFEPSKDSRYTKEYGIDVAFPVIEDFAASRKAYESGKCNLLWQTADAFPTEVGSLRAGGHDPVILFQSDWSRGGDIALGVRGINTVSDLRGKSVAVGFGTPSHTFLLRMLEAANMTTQDIKVVQVPSAIDAASAFKAGRVDAAIVWSPDDQDCLRTVVGSKIIASTREATHIIADVFFAERSWADSHKKEVKALVEGWMKGAAEINSDPEAKAKAVSVLSKGLNQPEDFIRTAIGNARLATYGDNVNFFNLNGNAVGVTGEKLYTETGALFQQNTDLVTSLPAWREVIETSALRSISFSGPEHAAEGEFKFSAATEKERSAPALAVKPASITFETGSAVLSENAKTIIDVSIAPIARSFRSMRMRIEGNTDNTGSDDVNRRLSLARARAVANYLVSQYNFDPNRFVVIGNGSDKPVAENETLEGRAKNRRTEFQLIGG